MNSLALAFRGLIRQPARGALGVAGVAIVGALLFDMLLLSRGLVVSFRDLLEATGFDVRVTANGAFPGMGTPIKDSRSAVAALRALSEVDDVVPMSLLRVEIAGAGTSAEKVELIGAGARVRGNWSVVQGQDVFDVAADGRPPIVIDRDLAQRLELAPGSPLQLRGACGALRSAVPAREFRVAGIARFRFDTADRATAGVLLDDLRAICGARTSDQADFLLVASNRTVGPVAAAAAIRRARTDLSAFSNEQLVARFARTDFSYFRQISFALTVVTLFFAFLLVATLLTVSVNQRLGEVAALRALGFARRRVVADLLWESGLFIGAGGLLALPAGLLLAGVLDTFLRAIPGIPEEMHFFVFEPRALAWHAALLGGTAVLSALYPVILVARLPIAATLRRETLS